MKTFISNNWKKIIIFLGIILVVYNLGTKIIAKPVLTEEYIENGKDVETDIIDGSDEIIDTEDMPASKVSSKDGEIYKFALLLGGLIIGVLVISEIAERKQAPAKKK